MKQLSNMNSLNQLSADLQRSMIGNRDFLFVVTANLVQHFPIRDWDQAQVRTKAQELLGSEQLTFSHWQQMLVITSDTSQTLLVVPKFQEI